MYLLYVINTIHLLITDYIYIYSKHVAFLLIIHIYIVVYILRLELLISYMKVNKQTIKMLYYSIETLIHDLYKMYTFYTIDNYLSWIFKFPVAMLGAFNIVYNIIYY